MSEKSTNELIKELSEKNAIDTDNISDGYHTFGELYELQFDSCPECGSDNIETDYSLPFDFCPICGSRNIETDDTQNGTGIVKCNSCNWECIAIEHEDNGKLGEEK